MFNSLPGGMYCPAYRRRSESASPPKATGDNPSLANANPASTIASFKALPHHQDALDDTNSNTIKCIPDYRNRIKRMIAFWKAHYPECHQKLSSLSLQHKKPTQNSTTMPKRISNTTSWTHSPSRTS